jgi:membrane protein implicated in regulation of membrane protease activity
VITAIAILLALFVLPQPWGVLAVAAGATIDLAETVFYVRWSQRRRAHVGVEALVGRSAVAVSALAPLGQVKIDGELWAARSDDPVESGAEVVVRAVESLTLLVERSSG